MYIVSIDSSCMSERKICAPLIAASVRMHLI